MRQLATLRLTHSSPPSSFLSQVPRSLSTSQSSDSLLDLNDVEFGFERGSNEEWGEEGGEFPTMSYHLEDIDEVDYAGEEEEEEGEGEGKKERLRKVASQRVCVRKVGVV